MKKFFLTCLGVALVIQSFGFSAQTEAWTQMQVYIFSDVTEETEYAEQIGDLIDQGVVQGYSDRTFRPDDFVSRAEFLKMAIGTADGYDWNLYLEKYNQEKGCFDDINGHWGESIICFAKKRKVVEGDELDGKFHPERRVNFAEATKILSKTRNYMMMDSIDDTESWYAQYIHEIQQYGIIPHSVLSPDHELTRGEVAALLSKNLDTFNTFYDPDQQLLTEPQVWKRIVDGTNVSPYFLSQGKVAYLKDKQKMILLSDKGDNFKRAEVSLDGCQDDAWVQALDFWTDGSQNFVGSEKVDITDPLEITCLGQPLDSFGRQRYATDGQNIYYLDYQNFDYERHPNLVIAQDVDFDTFEVLNYLFFKDKNNVYVAGIVNDSLVAKDFKVMQEVLAGSYGEVLFFTAIEDGNYYVVSEDFSGGAKILGNGIDLDLESLELMFEVGDRLLALDKNGFYTFREYSEIDDILIIDSLEINGLDASKITWSFENFFEVKLDDEGYNMDGYYFADDNNYYVLIDERLESKWSAENPDIEWFIATFDQISSQMKLLKLPYDQGDDFEFLGYRYFRVGEKVYYLDKLMEGVDAETFVIGEDEVEYTYDELYYRG